jgi:Zn-dependent protease
MFELLAISPLFFLLSVIGLLLSLSIHEFAHAWTADRLGDPTPRMQGRVTLNPLAHLDPIGTLLLLFTRFGWGKPVQFDPRNLENPIRDSALIALAGPASNLIIAAVMALLSRLGIVQGEILSYTLFLIAMINISLAIFNLVPVYPLDGSKIILPLLPRGLAIEYEDFMHRYGMFVLIALIFPWYQGNSPVSFLIGPVIDTIIKFLFG